METGLTSVFFVLSMLLLPKLFTTDVVSLSALNLFSVLSNGLVFLYLFELVFKDSMHVSLILHHVCLIVLYSMVTVTFYDSNNLWILRGAVLLLCTAFTEQLTFIGLLLYRVHSYLAPTVLILAAVAGCLLKTFFVATTVVCIVKGRILLWTVMGSILSVGILWPVQMYANYILWVLAKKTWRPIESRMGTFQTFEQVQ